MCIRDRTAPFKPRKTPTYPREAEYVTRREARTSGTNYMADKWIGDVVPVQAPSIARPRKIIAKRATKKKRMAAKTPTAQPGRQGLGASTRMGPTNFKTPSFGQKSAAAVPSAGGGTGIGRAWKGLSPDTKNILRVSGGALAGIALAKLFSDDGGVDIDSETTYKGPVYNRYYYNR